MTENLMFCLGRMLWQLTLTVTAAAACKQTVATSGGRVIVNFLKMPIFKVKVKWGREMYPDVEVNTDEEPMVFKAQLFALTGVETHRQKVMVKGGMLKDESWGNMKLKDGAMILLMGTKEEEIPTKPKEQVKFIEDMDESELQSALEMPAGLTNLGNTCYMNATVQCLKTVPELKNALFDYAPEVSLGAAAGSESQSITAALRDLYKTMDKGQTIPPIILLQVLHMAFPRFAEKSEHGGYQQQDANECWIELMRMLQQKLPPKENTSASSVIDQYFGGQFETVTKCIETEEEEPTKSKENFLQYSCYIDKEVKYLHSGMKNRLSENITKNSPKLGRDAEYIKTLSICRLPAYLTIQMVRFHFKQKEAVNAKILKDIKFPMMLDTFDFCSPELQQKLLPMRNKFKEYEDAIVDNLAKKRDMNREEAFRREREKAEELESEPYWFEDDIGSNNSGYYELQAVLTHKGRSSNSGHYVAWVKQKGDTWLECNDDNVQPVHSEDILKLSGGGDWHTAYLLLYGPRKLPIQPPKEEEKVTTEEKMDVTESKEAKN